MSELPLPPASSPKNVTQDRHAGCGTSTDVPGSAVSDRTKEILNRIATIGVFIVIGLLVGLLMGPWPVGLLIGALGGMIIGFLIIGLILMITSWKQ